MHELNDMFIVTTKGSDCQLHGPVEFEKYPVQVQDFRHIANHFKRIFKIYLTLIEDKRKISTCNWLDLETLGYRLILPKIYSLD